MSEDTFFWVVELIHGTPDAGGIGVKRELISKKYERVEGLIDSWSHLIDTGSYYASVISVATKSVETYSRGD
jgi:hypothetical protein